MQTSLTYRTNRDLFSNHYLDEHLPETEAWDEISDNELLDVKAEIMDIWEREKDTVPERTEASLEEKFIRPIYQNLGIPFEVEEIVSRTQRRPDYGFFETEEAARKAFDRRKEGGDFYENAVAVADAKRWGRPLDTRGAKKRDYENPSHQIDQYLRMTSTTWGVLTNGKKWRLYYRPTSHKLDSYYEVDLPTILEQGDLDDFKYFYLFFRHEAFLEDATGDAFLDDVYEESNVFAEELGEDLQENIYEAIKVLSEGFMQHHENTLDDEDLGLVHDSSLIYLYRIIFVLYAEAEGRDLLDTDNPIYEERYSINTLKQNVAEELDSDNPKYTGWGTDIGDRLKELFMLIDQGSKQQGIPEEDLYIPAYNGGLFRTDPDEGDTPEARFLAEHEVGDHHLARVMELLTRSANAGNGTTGEGKIFVDYSSLDVRHLGSIYEGLLEYQLNVADQPLAVEDGEYVPAGEDDEVVVEEGDIYLTTDSGERKATGSYYTPEYVVEYIVENTLGPLVEDIRKELAGQTAHGEGGFAGEFADRIFELKVLDPAMGSGHFLTSAVDYLAREIIDAQEKQAAQEGIETVNQERDINWARRQVAQRCIYGVDLNPLAVELAKVSLWLRTLAAEQPLAFLDHHLKTGNSLVGSDIERVLDNGDPDNGTADGQLTLQQSFDHTRQQALEQVTDRFEDLLAIDNETLDDIKEMEAVYEGARDDPLYQHLIAMANVHTAEQFGLDVPGDAHERMAEALRDDSWETIEGQDWYRSAQAMAGEERFFHWELEFPIAFYEQDGIRKDDSGFDAVIGNPPWISNWELTENNEHLVPVLEEMYNDVAKGHWDIFVPFCYRAINLLTDGGRHSFITPTSMGTEKYGTELRKYFVEESTIHKLVHFGDFQVFDEVDRQYIIYIVSPGQQNNNKVRLTEFEWPDFNTTSRINQSDFSEYSNYSLRPSLASVDMDIKKKIDSTSTPAGHICCVNVGVVAHAATDSELDFKKDDVIYEHEGEGYKKYIEARGISRYANDWDGQYIDYESKKEHFHRPKFPELFETEKMMIPRVSGAKNRIEASYDESGYYNNDNVNNVVLWTDKILEKQTPKEFEPLPNACNFNLKAITGIFNSTLMTYYFSHFLATDTLQGSYTSVYPQDIRKIPIHTGLQEERPKISGLGEYTEDMVSKKQERHALNLVLLDYLGIPSDELPESKAGETLETLQMPVAGVADTPLVETTEEYDGLRIEGVSFAEDGGQLVLSADISYKVEEDDPRETDRWDRLAASEFETYEAMAFVGLSAAQQTLLREFVPVAVAEKGGFAGFRGNATKNNSPLDRLKALTLPDIDAVQSGLEQYVEVRERADELEAKIEKTDALIDEIVYDLYGLTDEEIEIVEEAVGD